MEGTSVENIILDKNDPARENLRLKWPGLEELGQGLTALEGTIYSG